MELGYNKLDWFKRYHFLYLFGILMNFIPIRPYIQDMIETSKNMTYQQYHTEIYPMSSYSAAVISIVVLISIGFCVYNNVLIMYCLSGVAYTALMWQGTTIIEMQIAEGFKGIVLAAEVYYYTSIYLFTHKKQSFSRLTSNVRAIPLLTKVVAFLFAQTCLSRGWLGYKGITFLSIPAGVHALLILMHIPPLYESEKNPKGFALKWEFFKKTLKEIYSIEHLWLWILWSAGTHAGHTEIYSKIQSLWIIQNDNKYYNGGVDGIFCLLSFLAVLLCRSYQMDWSYHVYILMITSSVQALLLFIIANAGDLWVCNISYIIFGIVYHFVSTGLYTEIAKKVYKKTNFGITFSLIGCISSLVSLCFVFIIHSEHILSLQIEDKFQVDATYHVGLGVIVLLYWFFSSKMC